MSATVSPMPDLDDRDVAALTNYMTVLEDVGRARGAENLYSVTTQSGREYLVDAETGACECDDSFYRQPDGGCKHARRVEFATGRREIPAWVDRSRVDPQLGIHVSDVDQGDDDLDRGRGVETDGGLPDGWERINEDAQPYVKLVKRDAVSVPTRPRGEPFSRDAVVIITDELAGVVKGPGARQSWRVDDPERAGLRIVNVLEAWVDEGGDPYGGSALTDRLTNAVTESTSVLEAAGSDVDRGRGVETDGGRDQEAIYVGDVCLDLAQGRPVHVIEDTGQTAAEWSDANNYELTENYGNGRLGATDDDRVYDVVYCSSAKSEPSKSYAMPESRLLRIETEAADDGRPVAQRAVRDILEQLFDLAMILDDDWAVEPESFEDALVKLTTNHSDAMGELGDEAQELADVGHTIGDKEDDR